MNGLPTCERCGKKIRHQPFVVRKGFDSLFFCGICVIDIVCEWVQKNQEEA